MQLFADTKTTWFLHRYKCRRKEKNVSGISQHHGSNVFSLFVMDSPSTHPVASGCGESDEENDIFQRDPYLKDECVVFQNTHFLPRITHMRICNLKKSPTVNEVLASVVKLNPNVLAQSNNFYRRGAVTFCTCNGWKYDISVTNFTVKCFGCKRNIRSSDHRCKVSDLFESGEFLGKHTHTRYMDIRRNNFLLLEKKLPYNLPDSVIEFCNQTTQACQSIVFTETI